MHDPQKRIAGAFIVGALIVSLAFMLSTHTKAQKNLATAVVPIVERNHIPVADSDGDGVPNWQDALIDTDPIMLGTTTATYTKPTTITGNFAVNFFKDLMHSKMYGVFGDSTEEVIDKNTQQLKEDSRGQEFLESDLHVLPKDAPVSLRMYGNSIASILRSHPNKGESEILIFQDALQYKQPEKLEELTPIARAYGEMIQEMVALEVPFAYTQKHLTLVNALNALYEDVRAMQKINEDALYTFARVKRYQDDVLGLSGAITDLFNTLYFTDGVRWEQNEEVLQLITFTQ